MGIAAEYVTKNGRLKLKYEAGDVKSLFKFVAATQEIFEEEACGACGSKSIRFNHREVDGNSYFKMACDTCGHQMDFGQHKTGSGMFAKRDKGKNGWYDWKADRGSNPEPQSQPAARPSKPAPGPATDDVPF